MGVIRLLFWALIGVLVYWLVRRIARDSQPKARAQAPTAPAEDMVRCAVCGLNLPKSEALALDGQWACCAEHAKPRQPAVRP
ncbi:MAG TPA: PP0621 family protein [Burkholderiaceae bacterium]|nr:PP0621 family protein [Burkholderiaceae bacterium]